MTRWEGELRYLSGVWAGGWKLRYYVLDDEGNLLEYGSKNKTTKPKKTFALSYYYVNDKPELTGQHSFSLIQTNKDTSEAVQYFKAETEESYREWLRAISVMESQPPENVKLMTSEMHNSDLFEL